MYNYLVFYQPYTPTEDQSNFFSEGLVIINDMKTISLDFSKHYTSRSHTYNLESQTRQRVVQSTTESIDLDWKNQY